MNKIIYDASKENKDLNKIEKLERKAAKVLFVCKSVFPFDLFPDEIVVDLSKIDIIFKSFFRTEQIASIFISNLRSVTMETSIFFATIKLEANNAVSNPIAIRYLKKQDALILQQLLSGLISIEKNHIDVSHIPNEKLKEKLLEIGKVI